MHDSTTAILPCPVCGCTEPAIEYVHDGDAYRWWFFVKCPKCGIQGPWTEKCGLDTFHAYLNNERDNIIATWNGLPRK